MAEEVNELQSALPAQGRERLLRLRPQTVPASRRSPLAAAAAGGAAEASRLGGVAPAAVAVALAAA